MAGIPRSLRFRVQLAVVAVFVVAIALFMWGLHYVIVGSYQQIERSEATQDVERATSALLSSETWLTATARDWAKWTETYDFVTGNNPAYPKQNLMVASLKNLQIDFMVFYDPDDNVYWVTVADPRTGALLGQKDQFVRVFELAGSKIRPAGSNDTNTGLVSIEDKVAMFSSSVITNSEETASGGVLVVGRYVGQSQADAVRAVTHLDVTLSQPSAGLTTVARVQPEVAISYSEPDTINATRVLPDVTGNPGLVVTVSEQRTGHQRASETLTTIGWGALGLVVTIGIALGVTLEVTILRRLARLHLHVRRDDPNGETAVSRVGGTDEITDLARALDQAVETTHATETLLRYLAEHDELTGLPNRRRLAEEISKSVALAAREGTHVALLVIDLDDFKKINDEHGHGCGDSVLQWFAARALEVVREYSTVARIGGDEFAVLLPNTNRGDATHVVERLDALLGAEECTCSEGSLAVSASSGVAVYPEDADSADTLMVAADLQMYARKHEKQRAAEGRPG